LNLATLVLDLLVPPLSLLLIIISTVAMGTGLTMLAGLTATAFAISLGYLAAVIFAVSLHGFCAAGMFYLRNPWR